MDKFGERGDAPKAASETSAAGAGDPPADKQSVCELTFEKAVMLWTDGKLSSRPGYYAGRGPKRCDLNSDILEMLWRGIVKDIDATAGQHFVKMVDDLDDMSATAFLVSFQHYWASKWRWRGRMQQRGDGVTLSGRGEALYAEGMGAIFSALADKRDPQTRSWESEDIKREFLMRHGGCKSYGGWDDNGSGYPRRRTGFHKAGG